MERIMINVDVSNLVAGNLQSPLVEPPEEQPHIDDVVNENIAPQMLLDAPGVNEIAIRNVEPQVVPDALPEQPPAVLLNPELQQAAEQVNLRLQQALADGGIILRDVPPLDAEEHDIGARELLRQQLLIFAGAFLFVAFFLVGLIIATLLGAELGISIVTASILAAGFLGISGLFAFASRACFSRTASTTPDPKINVDHLKVSVEEPELPNPSNEIELSELIEMAQTESPEVLEGVTEMIGRITGKEKNWLGVPKEEEARIQFYGDLEKKTKLIIEGLQKKPEMTSLCLKDLARTRQFCTESFRDWAHKWHALLWDEKMEEETIQTQILKVLAQERTFLLDRIRIKIFRNSDVHLYNQILRVCGEEFGVLGTKNRAQDPFDKVYRDEAVRQSARKEFWKLYTPDHIRKTIEEGIQSSQIKRTLVVGCLGEQIQKKYPGREEELMEEFGLNVHPIKLSKAGIDCLLEATGVFRAS